MKAYAGIDLHSTNNYIGIINDNDQRLFKNDCPMTWMPYFPHWNRFNKTFTASL